MQRATRLLLASGLTWLLVAYWVADPVAHLVADGGAQPVTLSSGEQFWRVLDREFARWDENSNGMLESAELSRKSIDPTIEGPSAAALATLIRLGRSKTFAAPPFTRANLKRLLTEKRDDKQPDVSKWYAQGVAKLAALKRSVFESDPPRLETIHQGRMGNCFCLAPLGAMLARDPQSVVRCFRQLPDGRYELQLGQFRESVALPTDTELLLSASTEQSGVWVNLYEKAIGNLVNRFKPEDKQAETALDAIARGGSSSRVLELLTGHSVERVSLQFLHEGGDSVPDRAKKLAELRAQLRQAIADRRLVTCGTRALPTGVTGTPGITPKHAYAVLNFDPKRDVVTIWNPHGSSFRPKGKPGIENGYPRKDGQFEVPWNDFVRIFSSVTWETNRASTLKPMTESGASPATNRKPTPNKP
ncbi:C2 family cysteine protease [Tuwongella immobilis]|uniref:Calpain catalytic domain-containing protein n=1 Tax=Tuwongella immobilis TaxID=692036 RepID=A0A6C2YHY7_9BACT|nr:C2 family cysteine protease [Tuwongella immobilis]VIP00675.1 peptidase c2 : Peptidase C2 OS=Opitutaceae bacterium TAV5 GN=OPIT5_08715 PE=4 SV=1: Peptidase_C2 [Tuwongella immobilis]VTR96768.1 peptidase c2 : Peptidase C2 OS=Opitutaceae bacterium TAV5 GN=OPIT5_08715 PE=4 SV=1: Peptidase_C2 [Tuwongella immobilis]